VEGFDIRVSDAGRYIVTQVDGRAMPVTVEEYKQRLAAKLVEEAPTLESFRANWIEPPERRELLGKLPEGGRSASLIRSLEEMSDFDLYDVLAELGYGLAPKRRVERADAFNYKHEKWLNGLPKKTAATLKALASQFSRVGTDGLESPQVFQTPEVTKAGGLDALKDLGKPGVKVGVGHEKQCALGALTQETLKVDGTLNDVMKNVVVQVPAGDMLINQLKAGGLDAAVAYVSNAANSGDVLEAIPVDIPCALATQPVAVSKSSPRKELARRLIAAFTSDRSKQRFLDEGFRWQVNSSAPR